MSNFELIINPPTNSIAFYFAGFPVRYYGIIIAISLVIGFCCVNNFLKKVYSPVESDKFIDYSIYLVIFSIIGARLFYILGSLEYYLKSPLEIVMINHGGISIWGGIIFGILSLFILSNNFKFSFRRHVSVISIFMPFCQAIGRWGNYFNQEAFGKPTEGLIKLFVTRNHRPFDTIDISYYHPAFLYECVLDTVIFVILYLTFDKHKPIRTFYLYLILYSVARIIVESVRVDSVFNVSTIHVATIISLIMFSIGLIGFIYDLKKPYHEGY